MGKKWKTKKGEEVYVCDMSTRHLKNAKEILVKKLMLMSLGRDTVFDWGLRQQSIYDVVEEFIEWIEAFDAELTARERASKGEGYA
jgi:hypothetical protein